MKSRDILPNVLTALALSCGLFVIFKINMLDPGPISYHNMLVVVGVLMLASFLDLLDGALARAMKVESDFGGVFDSMADAVSFGVAPSVVILKTLSLTPGSLLSILLTASAMIYSISGVLRLVRFTVTRYQIQGDKEKMEEYKSCFTGLPIPAAASIVISSALLLISDEFTSTFSLSETSRAIIITLILFFIGYFMISRWKFPSLKTLRIRVASFKVVFFTSCFAALVLVGAISHFPVVFAGLSWFYMLVAGVLSVVRRLAGNKVPMLEDFDPEDE